MRPVIELSGHYVFRFWAGWRAVGLGLASTEEDPKNGGYDAPEGKVNPDLC